MDKKQAEAISEAILKPGLDARQDRRERRAAAEAKLAAADRTRRVVAWCGVAGAIAGALVGHFWGVGLSRGIIWGGLPMALLGWGIGYWKYQHASVSSR